MKPTSFFLEKAESFSEQLYEINLIEYKETFSDDIYQDRIEGDNAEYYEQGKTLEEIKFQIRLMFNEFDKGSLFLEKIENFKAEQLFDRNPEQLKNLKEVIELFIDFLKEYRS